MDVFVGGGVRDIKDLVELKNLGVSGVLVATALHSGKISIEELKKRWIALTDAIHVLPSKQFRQAE